MAKRNVEPGKAKKTELDSFGESGKWDLKSFFFHRLPLLLPKLMIIIYPLTNYLMFKKNRRNY